jgi:hypothetical protein
MQKEIRIFDASNNVLKVSGIIFELFDVATGKLVGNDTSKDLNPPHDEWGVKLIFSPASAGAFEVYTNDPTYKYPGNVIESLEGANSNRIDIDLVAVPAHTGGQGPLSGTATVIEVLNWIQSAPNWKVGEKRAVRNLFLNYIKLIMNFDGPPEKTALGKVVQNWQEAMRRLKIPFEHLRVIADTQQV